MGVGGRTLEPRPRLEPIQPMEEPGASEPVSSAEPGQDPPGFFVFPVDRTGSPVSDLDGANDNWGIGAGTVAGDTPADAGSGTQQRHDVSHASPIDGGGRAMKSTWACYLVVPARFNTPCTKPQSTHH